MRALVRAGVLAVRELVCVRAKRNELWQLALAAGFRLLKRKCMGNLSPLPAPYSPH